MNGSAHRTGISRNVRLNQDKFFLMDPDLIFPGMRIRIQMGPLIFGPPDTNPLLFSLNPYPDPVTTDL